MRFTALSTIVLAAAQVSLVNSAAVEERQILGLCTSTTLPLPLCGSIFGSCGSGCSCVNLVNSIPILGSTLSGLLGGLLGSLLPLPGICSSGGSLPLGLNECVELGCTTDADCTACSGAVCTALSGSSVQASGTNVSVCLPPDFDPSLL
ncbi:hypothetical protein V8D89_015317 [Ganoderma adspersum]